MSDLTRTIVVAAEDGDLSTVKRALADGASPDAMGPNSGALQCAAFGGHKAVLATLLKAGARADATDHQGFSALHLAASRDHQPCIKLLLQHGADLELATPAGGTALHVAAASGHVRSTKALLAAGASVAARDANGATPLIAAASGGQLGTVKPLLQAGADPNDIDDRDGLTALHHALRAALGKRPEHWKTEGSNDGIPVFYEIIRGDFAYHVAGHRRSFRLKDQRFCAKQWWGPQHWLAYDDTIEVARACLKAGADPSIGGMGGTDGLFLAAVVGEPRVMNDLVKDGRCEPAQVAAGGTTLLHAVARSGRFDGVQWWLKKVKPTPEQVAARDAHGWTPLHELATSGGDPAVVGLLREAGVKRQLKTTRAMGDVPRGLTAAALAARLGHDALAEALSA